MPPRYVRRGNCTQLVLVCAPVGECLTPQTLFRAVLVLKGTKEAPGGQGEKQNTKKGGEEAVLCVRDITAGAGK